MTPPRHSYVHEPTALERATSQFNKAMHACTHSDLEDAIAHGRLAISILETELQFRDAKRNRA